MFFLNEAPFHPSNSLLALVSVFSLYDYRLIQLTCKPNLATSQTETNTQITLRLVLVQNGSAWETLPPWCTKKLSLVSTSSLLTFVWVYHIHNSHSIVHIQEQKWLINSKMIVKLMIVLTRSRAGTSTWRSSCYPTQDRLLSGQRFSLKFFLEQ